VAPIYLDYNATTPLDPAVVDAMLPYLREHFGNPSSSHAYGRTAHEAVDRARQQVAELIQARPEEIVFTGGGSEASNLAIKGVILPLLFGLNPERAGCPVDQLQASPFRRLLSWLGRLRSGRRGGVHVITSSVEHPATLQPGAFLERLGCQVTVLPVDRFGVVDLDALSMALQQPTALVTIMHSNNEVGTLQPIKEITKLAHERGALMHTDAAQSLGKLMVHVQELGVDLLSVAGHKLYAPKGVGALYVRDGVLLEPLIHGAGHERGRRAGTENVPYLVGLGAACAIAQKSLPAATERLRILRDRLWQRLKSELAGQVVLNGHAEERLPNTLNVSFLGHIGAELLQATPEIAASTGSACHEGQVHLSPVLRAMGVSSEIGRGAVRLSVGRFTTEDEVDRAAEALTEAVRAKAQGPVTV
jgi:cysteine desulfurase